MLHLIFYLFVFYTFYFMILYYVNTESYECVFTLEVDLGGTIAVG